jgi:hypothetical protein
LAEREALGFPLLAQPPLEAPAPPAL